MRFSEVRDAISAAGGVHPHDLHRPTIYVAFGFVAAIVLVIAQLYYFVKLQSVVAELSGIAFGLSVTFGTTFLFFCWVAATRYLVMMICAYFGWADTVRPRPQPTRWPAVSILVPAFNEADRIASTLDSIMALDYPNYDVIVVDDGSQDRTFKIASHFVRTEGPIRVRVLRKRNGGKSTALNLAFRESTSELVMCVDADSRLERQCLRRLVPAFERRDVAAVAGQVRVRNRDTLVSKLQALEYALMNGMPRLAQSWFTQVLIAPGPVAMFRRSVLIQIWDLWGKHPDQRIEAGQVVGPWETDTFAEDCDLTLNVLLLGKRVVFEPAAISYTTAPAWLFGLLNQRYRWIRGNIQAIKKCWRRWHQLPSGPPMLPVWLGIFIVETVVWPAVNIYGLVMFAALVIAVGQVGTLIPWYLTLLLIEVNAAAFSVRVMGEKRALIVLIPFFRSVYSVLLDMNTLCSLFAEFVGQRMSWA